MSTFVSWLSQKGLGQTLIGTAIGIGLAQVGIYVHEKYGRKKVTLVAMQKLSPEEMHQESKKDEIRDKYLFLPAGSHPDKIDSLKAKKHLDAGNFVFCEPDAEYLKGFYITNFKDPLACDVIKEKAKRQIDLFHKAIEIWENDPRKTHLIEQTKCLLAIEEKNKKKAMVYNGIKMLKNPVESH